MDGLSSPHKLRSVYFSFYKPAQISELSVVRIHKFKAFDKHGRAIKGGLYDPAMGVSPTDRHSK